jgi:hypothetical protein
VIVHRHCRRRAMQYGLEIDPRGGKISHCFHPAATCAAASRTTTP